MRGGGEIVMVIILAIVLFVILRLASF